MSKECLDPYKIASAGTRRFLDEGGNRHKKWIPGQAHKRIGEIGEEVAKHIPEEVKGAVKAAVPVITGVGAALVSAEVAYAAESVQVSDQKPVHPEDYLRLIGFSIGLTIGVLDKFLSSSRPKEQYYFKGIVDRTTFVLESSALGMLLGSAAYSGFDLQQNISNGTYANLNLIGHAIVPAAYLTGAGVLAKDLSKKSSILNEQK
jgi:hypothetical protein